MLAQKPLQSLVLLPGSLRHPLSPWPDEAVSSTGEPALLPARSSGAQCRPSLQGPALQEEHLWCRVKSRAAGHGWGWNGNATANCFQAALSLAVQRQGQVGVSR